MREVLDSSGALDLYLFGGAQGSSDRSLIHVVQVDATTPLPCASKRGDAVGN